jgi:hypothetical protein
MVSVTNVCQRMTLCRIACLAEESEIGITLFSGDVGAKKLLKGVTSRYEAHAHNTYIEARLSELVWRAGGVQTCIVL